MIACLGVHAAELFDGFDPVHAGTHGQVHEDHVRGMLPGRLQRVLPGCGFPDDGDVALGAQQRFEPAPDHGVVVHEQHGDGVHKASFKAFA